MKPISLKISAFGPYAKTTTLNFKDDLKNQDIFVITGPTGAGKTTIFDAICYALYGETSGNKRRGEELRSDFASLEDDKTEVEFIFEVKDKQYCINRMPKQFQKKKRGEGLKEVPASVELRELDSERAPLTKEGDVKNEIQTILGLSVDQFRKIVMIPQGDFKEFLYANTSSKEELLRKIFGTYLYKEIQEQLMMQANALKVEVADKQKDIQSQLSVLKCETNETLKELIASNARILDIIDEAKRDLTVCEGNQLEAKRHLNEVAMELEQQLQRRQKGALLNQKFSQLGQVEQRLQQLGASSAIMAALEEEFMLAKKASSLSVLENEVVKYQVLVNQTTLQQQQSQLYLEDLMQQLILVKNCYDGLEEWKQKQELLTQEINLLTTYGKDLQQMDRCRYQSLELQREAAKASKQLLEGQTQLEQLKHRVSEIESLQQAHSQLKEASFKLQLTLNDVLQAKEQVMQLSTRWQSYLKHQQQARQLAQNLKMMAEQSNQSRVDYEYQATLFVNAAAIRLANELKIGEACPVCGSTEHPNPKRSHEVILTKTELEERRLQVEQLEREVRKVEQDALSIQATMSEEKRVIEELMIPLSALLMVDDQMLVSLEQVSQLDLNLELQKQALEQQALTLKEELTKIEQQLEVLNSLKEQQVVFEQHIKQLEIIGQEKQSAYLAEQRLLEELSQRIPAKYQDYEYLKSSLQELKQQKNQIELNIHKIQDDYQKLTLEIASTNATLAALEQQVKQYQMSLQEASHVFEQKLEESFQSFKSYQLAKREEEQLILFEQQLTSFAKELHATQSQQSQLSQELEGQTLMNLEAVDELIQHLSTQKDEWMNEVKTWDFIIKHNEQLIQQIERSYQLIQKREEEYRTIGELAELSNGRSGGKMSFETYVLSSYFDEVLQAANQRLEKMTSRRYYLLRREEVKGGGRKGLDLDVYDSHTCKKRPVNTLSGGESFKASLALALGLSDTVQQTTGGIQLDTMFIDEGFGTLDSESLEQAIDILMELQDHGRLIGVISHVNELKERIPSKLVVEMDVNGSRAYFKR